MSKIILVGEANPYGADPRYALYPEPRRSAGGRLCHDILKMTPKEYLGKFDRVNLCPLQWSLRAARDKALELSDSGRPLILLGAKVCKAFGKPFEPFTFNHALLFVILPHPSGLSRLWNSPDAFTRAWSIVAELRGAVGDPQLFPVVPERKT